MGQKVNPHGLRVGIIQDGMQKKISQTILLKMIKSENILKIVYTAQEFLEQKSNVLLIV